MKRPGHAAATVAPMLVEQALARGSGVIRCGNKKHRRLICIERGEVVAVISNVKEEQPHAALVERRLLGPADLAALLREAKQSGRHPLALIGEHAMVPEAALAEAYRTQLYELCCSTLRWDQGEFSFERGMPNLGFELRAPVVVASLIFRFTALHPEQPGLLKVLLGRPNMLVEVDESRLTLLDGPELDATATFLLERCDGRHRIPELVELAPAEEEPVLRTLYALTLLGVVREVRRESVVSDERPVTRDEVQGLLSRGSSNEHYHVLGVTRSATPEAIREAYYRLARRVHPDRFRAGELRDLLEGVERFFTQVTEAYNTLADPALRRDYDESLDAAERPAAAAASTRSLAEENYLRGKALIERRRFQDAMQFLKNAIEADETEPKYHVEYGVLMAGNPRYKQEAEHHLTRGLELDPTNVRCGIALAELMTRSGRRDQAVTLYERVLAWDPGNSAATDALSKLTGKRRGLFG